jgi:hypothetical protein
MDCETQPSNRLFIMKKTILILSLAALFTSVGAVRSLAYDHDSHGWYDDHHHRHAFIHHNGHRGYWDQRDGTKVFINI